MKILVSWLREFVAVTDGPEAIARALSVRGFAVEGIELTGDGDTVLDFEVTANRPDCLSVAGLAREVATAYNLPLTTVGGPAVPGAPAPLSTASLTPVETSEITVDIEAADLCSRYVGAVADVTATKTPAWMQARLVAAGVRPISPIVDVTNYVLLELGQPMHAFDLDRLERGRIRVRRATAGERIRTLDGQDRTLAPEMLVIADASRAVAIAGVMGGAESEVSATTRTVVFESAHFTPLSVRRTSRRLGLKTEASTRFERGVDPHLALLAMTRACALLEQIGAGRARGTAIDRVATPITPLVLPLRRSRLDGLLGARVPDAETARILTNLGFGVRDVPEGWEVTVPTRRVDVQRDVDLIEEVARHYGFDRIPVTFPTLASAPRPVDPRITRARQLRMVMTAQGFSEAVTFGFIARPAAERFAAGDALVPIANPLSETFAVLRPSGLPGLIDAVAHNRRRERRDVRLFEAGAVFSRTGGERRVLACAWTGQAAAAHWSGAVRDVDFFDMKGVAERVADAFRLEVTVVPHAEPWLVPGRSGAVMVGNVRLGVTGLLTPAVAEQAGLPAADAVYVLEVDLDVAEQLAPRTDVRVEPLPRFPSVTRDLSILVADTLPAADVRRTIRAAAPPTLVRVTEFDRYQGKGVPEGQVSLSVRLVFQSPDRTLTDAEVQDAMAAVLGGLQATHGAVQR